LFKKCLQTKEKVELKWKNTDGDARANLMMKALEIVKRRHKELAKWEAKDVGKPIFEAENTDLPYAFMVMEYFSNIARQIRGNQVPIKDNTALCYETWEPYGVVGLFFNSSNCL
jgi:acyl-CoA reductase-like NAD-dependent aldehyde dehydrogenase